jgi:spore coat polysaccharide biosynthesis protein SpsF
VRQYDEQESFWAGGFGSDYISRNNGLDIVDSNASLFKRIFSSMDHDPESILELGANIGLNYLGIRKVLQDFNFTGVEINGTALERLRETGCEAVGSSIYDYQPVKKFELVFTKGVLIHINPDRLLEIYDKIFSLSQKYVLVIEYYSPNPVELGYRGNSNKLFKRDFAGDMLDRFSDLALVDYGFVYHRGNMPQDDLTWFLMSKVSNP